MDSPLLVIVFMMKNESDAIVNTLKPFVDAGINHISILDTGSTDSSVEIAKEFFLTHNVNGFVDESPFVDFATSRNQTLEFAEKNFPNAHFFLMVDADWYIQNPQKLLEFCEEEKSNSDPLYFIRVLLGNLGYSSPRLFRVNAKNRYVGVVHEIPERIPTKTIPQEAHFLHVVNETNHRKSFARYTRDADLLLAEHEKNPTHARTLFYLAQTYECLSDLKNAYKYYLKRSKVKGWVEEDMVATYRLGILAENLSQVDDTITWHTALDFYLKAYALRPHRIESLVKIALYYLPTNPHLSYVYMKHACSVPYPKDDLLFVPREMYDFVRYDVLSVAAWYAADYVGGRDATIMALKAFPNNDALKQKLEVYEAMIQKSAPPLEISTPSPIIVPNIIPQNISIQMQ